MSTKHLLKTDSSNTQKPPEKKHRRHTRAHLDALRPILANVKDSQCPKCQGYVGTEAGESLRLMVTRCLNCGWQPHYLAPIIQETEEAKMCRLRSAQFVLEGDSYRMPIVR